MMRISTQTFFELSAAGMNSLQQQLFRVQQKLGAGTKVLTPSDDPVAAARGLVTRQSMSESAQYSLSRGRATQSLSMEEGALQSATTVLQDVKTLIVQAGNGTLTDADRSTLATALEGQFTQMLGAANSDDGNGHYLFAGYKSSTPPFVQQANGSVAYTGDQGQRLMQVDVARQMGGTDDGSTVFQSVQGSAAYVTTAGSLNTGTGVFSAASVSDGRNYAITFGAGGAYTVDDGTTLFNGVLGTGGAIAAGGSNGLKIRIDGAPAAGDVFTVASAQTGGAPAMDVFTAVGDLIASLRAPVADAAGSARLQNALSTANVKITNAYDNVLTVRSSVGSRMAELDALNAGGQRRDLVDQSYLSGLEDLDYAGAISEFTQRETNLKATQQTFAKLQSIALFNYL
jgi:flagellar hook-associated protein 3 FlgL